MGVDDVCSSCLRLDYLNRILEEILTVAGRWQAPLSVHTPRKGLRPKSATTNA